MKILIMGFTKVKYMPYINFYLENLDTAENDVHILYWNRDLQEEPLDKYSSFVLHEFKCYQEDDVSKLSKVGSFIKYRSYAKKIIKNERFDLIIILHSLPGVVLADVLKKSYKGKYILDYRDSTYEGFAPFKKIIGDLVEGSVATYVSSDAFRRFLPQDCSAKIYTSHNLLLDSLSHRNEKRINGTKSDKIRIAFWGFIRHEDVNRQIIDKLANDSRFELHYYGREQQVALSLKAHASEIGAANVFFHGEYVPEERYEFVRNTDLIHNVYFDDNMMLAMGNKYYDAAIFYIPLVSMRGSFMAEMAQKAGIGFDVDPYSDDFADKLFEAYKNLDVDKFTDSCDAELQRVLEEYRSGARLVRSLTGKVESKIGSI